MKSKRTYADRADYIKKAVAKRRKKLRDVHAGITQLSTEA